jgi:CheY-like chemotaxis protein
VRILCVEDDHRSAGVVSCVLEAVGYRVVCVPDGRMAIEALASERFDLILLDLGLPDMDGFTMLERVRRLGHADGVRVLVVTGCVDEPFRTRAAELGCVGFLEKPVRVPVLRQAVARALRTAVGEPATRCGGDP